MTAWLGELADAGRWPGWREASWSRRLRRCGAVVVRSVRDLFTDDGPQWAAAIAYYSLLSAFPLLLAAIAIAAAFADPQRAAGQIVELLGSVIPQDQRSAVAGIVRRAAAVSGRVGLLSLGTLLWTGTRVFGALTKALNVAYDVEETYGFFKRLLIEAVMLLTIGLFFIFALASGVLFDLLWRVLQRFPADPGPVFVLARGALQLVLLLAAFFLIYRFVPRGNRDSRSALAGATIATLLFVLARPLFVGYVRQFGSYELVYGSLAIAILLILWAWIVALITLLGGEIAGHVRSMLLAGESTEATGSRQRGRASAQRTGPDDPGDAARPSAPGPPTPGRGVAPPPARTRTVPLAAVAAFLCGAALARLLGKRAG